jgi:hypothetical protein
MKRLCFGILVVFFVTGVLSEAVEAEPSQVKASTEKASTKSSKNSATNATSKNKDKEAVQAKAPKGKASAKSSKSSDKNATSKDKDKEAVEPKISAALGEVKWGMNEDTVLNVLIKNVHERYRPLIAKTKDAIDDDRLRVRERQDIDDIKKSLIRFEGQTTGWDLGFLRDEFTHHNGESMLVVKDSNSQNFYFFIGGKLWKWYKAFESSAFSGKGGGEFAAAIERKFGQGKQTEGELYSGAEKRQWIEWQDKKTRLRAIDQTSFYGFYCLVFEDKQTLETIASLRTNPSNRHDIKKHALVESVTSDADLAANPDESPNIVDRITGKVRQREDMPQQKAAKTSTTARNKKQSRQQPTESSSPTTKEYDPTDGLN